MAETINWLHLTDLHQGIDSHGWLWPKVKHDFYADVQKLADQVGPWDLVFFTGDLTQKGSEEEFSSLNRELEALWKILSKTGKTPHLCVVPGNHDLVRPAMDSAAARALTKHWQTDADLRHQFWSTSDTEYHRLINEVFRNYLNWRKNLAVPQLEYTAGIIPGDFSTTFVKGTIKLGIVGLNTAFLQLAGGDFKGKLEVHFSQFGAICNGDPVAWLRRQSASILLTHQPPSWFTPGCLEHFRQMIYPPGQFIAQYCGHQHEPDVFETSEAGAVSRRLRQTASLFGLESWDGGHPQKRLHGYTGGQFIFEEGGGIEKLFPRTTVVRRHGGFSFCPDNSFALQDDNSIISHFELQETLSDSQSPEPTGASQSKTLSEHARESVPSELPLIEEQLDERTSETRLASCPRFSIIATPSHRAVRLDEQSQFEHELRRMRRVWLLADWGTGKEGFLSAALERFRQDNSQVNVFHVRCDDAQDIDAFERLFPQQFAMSLQSFCAMAAAVGVSFLLLDEVHPEICRGKDFSAFDRITQAIADFCPRIGIIVASRVSPDAEVFPIVRLRPLDAPDVKVYLSHHPEIGASVLDADTIEKLHDRSEGLPRHLDRILEALRVSSLTSVLNTEEEQLPTQEGNESTSKALVHAVTGLGISEDRQQKRSLRLLQVLSVLTYGETIESISHYLPAEPFFAKNALQLAEQALIDIIPLFYSNPQVALEKDPLNEHDAPKLLKVPRQVRDYVLTTLPDEHRQQIVSLGIDRFFGRNWREGKIKLRCNTPEYREYAFGGAGNEFALIQHLISSSRAIGDDISLKRAAKLAIHYAKRLESTDRFRDLVTVAGSVVQTIDRDEQPADWAELAALHAEGLRMLGRNEEALNYGKAAWEVGGELLFDGRKASIWLGIALAEQVNKNFDAALVAANQVKNFAKERSSQALQAEAIIVESTLQDDIRKLALMNLEKEARDAGWANLSDTLCLKLARLSTSYAEKMRYLDRVLEDRSGGYNQVVAILRKARLASSLENSGAGKIEGKDLNALSVAYSYFYAQRLSSMFDSCHEVLWTIYERQGDVDRLLRLFRYTSFVWRIRGKEDKEAEYARKLQEIQSKQSNSSSGTGRKFLLETRYFMQRLKILIVQIIEK